MSPGTGLLVIATMALLTGACGEREGSVTSTTTGITSNVTTLTPDGTSTSSGGSTSDGSGTGGGDDSSSSTTTTTGSTEASASATGTSTTDPADGTTTDASTGTTAADPVQECLAMVDPGDECTACICTDCLMLWDTCYADEGCAAIQNCAQKEGCYGLQCFSDCQSTVLINGGPYGAAWKLWEPLTACLEATCRPLCPW